MDSDFLFTNSEQFHEEYLQLNWPFLFCFCRIYCRSLRKLVTTQLKSVCSQCNWAVRQLFSFLQTEIFPLFWNHMVRLLNGKRRINLSFLTSVQTFKRRDG